MPSRASARGCSGSTASRRSSNARKETDEHHQRHDPERARDPRRADLRRTARARLLRLDRPKADPGVVGRRHRRRGDGRPSRRHVPLPHRLRRRRGRVPRGRCARAARADLPEPPADARVRGSRRPDEADADDALRHHRGARHDDAVRRRGRSQERLCARGRAAAASDDPAKEATVSTKKAKGFTADEQAAMKARAQELKAEARANKNKADGERDLLAAIAEMTGKDRAMAKRLHAIIKGSAPALWPKTWYGMPAYAKDGKVVCYFQSAQKFKSRYATFGFSDEANLDKGAMWPTAFALKELTSAGEASISALVKKAVS